MTDIRERVAEDRTFLKKLELAIPGFRGYRKKEDRRVADSLLRKQIADRLKECVKAAENIRAELASQMELDMIKDAGNLVNRLEALESKVRHAEQGYTGISPDIRIFENEIEKLYEFDYGLIEKVNKLADLLGNAKESISIGDMDSLRIQMLSLKAEIGDFNSLLRRRTEIITKTGVFA